jgi:3-deoxy-D-manno-octulosonic-acid transferase
MAAQCRQRVAMRRAFTMNRRRGRRLAAARAEPRAPGSLESRRLDAEPAPSRPTAAATGRAPVIWRACYSVLMHLARAGVWLWWRWRARREPMWGQRWDERRGRAAPPAGVAGGIVVHAVSMGEVMAATPLVQALLAHPEWGHVTLTCTTPTASALIRERFGERVRHVYLPFDTPGATRRFLAACQPRALLVMETELWPNLLAACADQAVPVALVNARLSAASARGYARLGPILRTLAEPIDQVLAQSEVERARFVSLGFAAPRVAVIGNLKADLAEPDASQVRLLRAFAAGRRVVLAASTHEGEEAALIDAWQAALADDEAPLLALAPRHPQRFDDVASLLAARGVRFARRSSERAAAPDESVLLIDRMGEVPAWCAVAEWVYVGGSLVEVGGHNPLEPASQGRAVAAGPSVFNFQAAFDALDAAGGTLRVTDASALAALLRRWRAEPEPFARAGEAARRVAERAGGALARTLAALGPWLDRLPQRRDVPWPDGAARHDAALLPTLSADHFAPAWWQAQGRARAHASGRRPVWFVRAPASGAAAEREWVLRHYWRGGFVGKFLSDRFAPPGAARSRALREWRLLARLHAWGLPAPRPVAARHQRAWPGCRADILVERLDDARDVAALLGEAPLPAAAWQALGTAIGHLHAARVWHADLNAHNLLLDRAGRAWIVDFDRGRVRLGSDTGWAHENLARLERSLEKLRRERGAHWDAVRDGPPLRAAWRAALQESEPVAY